jgi:Calcineurin-like phosphoesterase
MTRTTFRLFAISACMVAGSACSDATTGNAGNAGNESGGAPGASGASNTGGNTGGAQTSTAGASGGGASSVGNGGTTSPNGGTGGTTGASGSSGTSGTPGAGGSIVSNGDVSTDPNLKIGFIGDSDSGANFTNVLNLVKSEGASALVVEGDMSYSADPTAWWNALEGVMGAAYPVFISRGNHDDSSWAGYLPKADAHLGGATREAGAHDANYKTTYKGLVIAAIKKGDTGSNITPFLQGDPHIWKICSWHQNQQSMQIGGKGDEMGWDVYETCRQQGAIIQTGHEHSYERTKTLTSVSSQTVDAACASATTLCVGPGRTFTNVVGLGGNSVRDQTRCLPSTPPYGCNGEWGFVYTNQQSATYGAQFITFNAGGPKAATGYFKNINGETVDTFTITHD